MADSKATRPWRLVEVWGDTADQSHLAWSVGIGIVVSLGGFLIANSVLRTSLNSPELARAYAMLAGLAGCVASGVICAVLFKPKREVVEGPGADPFWRQEVLAKLTEQYGDLGSVADLPPAVVKEMKELEIYDLFANFKPASDTAGATLDHAKRSAMSNTTVANPSTAQSRSA
jgi:multidrug transporter EmrE-like cation transporter